MSGVFHERLEHALTHTGQVERGPAIKGKLAGYRLVGSLFRYAMNGVMISPRVDAFDKVCWGRLTPSWECYTWGAPRCGSDHRTHLDERWPSLRRLDAGPRRDEGGPLRRR